jgi:two-component system sensor histidine kinase VicK
VVRVELSDSGIGIAPDKIDTLFQKFVRMREATGINISGTGLGLYVAKQMVEAHNGKIWAESAGLGKGTTFVVELPLSTHEPKEPASHE